MSDLVAWVRAQLDATERDVYGRRATVHAMACDGFPCETTESGFAEARIREVDNCDCGGPELALADVAAKRKLLYLFTEGSGKTSPYLAAAAIRLLAEGFRGRPGYEEAMRDE